MILVAAMMLRQAPMMGRMEMLFEYRPHARLARIDAHRSTDLSSALSLHVTIKSSHDVIGNTDCRQSGEGTLACGCHIDSSDILSVGDQMQINYETLLYED
jgi:hypothetical protein